MKSRTGILLLLLAASVCQGAVLTNMPVRAIDSVSQNLANRYVTLTPTDENYVYNGLVSAEPVKQRLDSNAETIFTNVVLGYYTLDLASSPRSRFYLHVDVSTNSLNVTNFIEATEGANGIGTAYSKTQADGRFVRLDYTNHGDNVLFDARGLDGNLTPATSNLLQLAQAVDDLSTASLGLTNVTEDANGVTIGAGVDLNVSGDILSDAGSISGFATASGTAVSANTITANSAFVGNGASLTNLHGTNIQFGTINSNAMNAATLAAFTAGGDGHTNLYETGAAVSISNAVDFLPDTDSSSDIGSTSKRFANGYFDDVDTTGLAVGASGLSVSGDVSATGDALFSQAVDIGGTIYNGSGSLFLDDEVTVGDGLTAGTHLTASNGNFKYIGPSGVAALGVAGDLFTVGSVGVNTTINTSNIFQVDAPGLSLALQVHTNGNVYLNGSLIFNNGSVSGIDTLTVGAIQGNALGITNVNASSVLEDSSDDVLRVPSYNGTADVQTHPSLVISEDEGGGFGGYRYWLAYSQFPVQSNEWSMVAASHDMVHWVDPTAGGDGPDVIGQDELLSLNNADGIGDNWIADPCLYINTNGTMHLLSLALFSGGSGFTNWLICRSSTDGVNWGAVHVIEEQDIGTDVAMACPVIVETNNYLNQRGIRLYYINEQDYGTNALCFREAVDGSGTNWSGTENVCTLPTFASSATTPWHFDIKYSRGFYHMVYGSSGGTIFASGIYPEYARSIDGVTWETFDDALPRDIFADNAYGLYKPTMWPEWDGTWGMIVGMHGGGVGSQLASVNNWQLKLRRGVELPSPKFTKWLIPQDGRESGGTDPGDPILGNMYAASVGHTTITTSWGFPINGSTETVRYWIPLEEFPASIRDGSMTVHIDALYSLTNETYTTTRYYYATLEDDGTQSSLLSVADNEMLGSGAGRQLYWHRSVGNISVTTKDGLLFLGLGTQGGAPTNTVFLMAWKLTAW